MKSLLAFLFYVLAIGLAWSFYEYEFVNRCGDMHYPYRHTRFYCLPCRREMNNHYPYPAWEINRIKPVKECENCGTQKEIEAAQPRVKSDVAKPSAKLGE